MNKSLQLAVSLLLVVPAPGVLAQPGAAAGGEAPASAASVDPVEADTAAVVSDDPVATQTRAPRGGLVEEIIVTAQKREEKLLNVPIAVQAFSPEALEARGITNQAGLQRATPGLDIASNAGFTTIFLRGVGTEAFLTADPSIANYIDGVYYSFSPSFSQEFGAVKRVEVLKGPQGTLFGRNAVGGAINVLTKEPDFQEASTDVSSTVGDFNLIKSSIYTNVPINDQLAFNVSGFYSTSDSPLYKHSSAAGKPLETEVASGFKLKVRLAPIDDLDIVLGYTKSHGQSNSDFPSNLFPSPLGQALGIKTPPGHKGYESHVDENLYLNSNIQVFQFEGRYATPYFDTKLLYSEQKDRQPFNYDFDGSDKPLVSFNIIGHYALIKEAEFQILSNASSPFSEWLTFTGGVFYYQNKQGFSPIRVTVGNLDPANLVGTDGLPLVLPPEFTAVLDNVFGPNGDLAQLSSRLPAGSTAIKNPFYTVEDEALAGTFSTSEYLQLTGRFTDWVSLTVGARYQNEERHVVNSTTSLQVDGGLFVPLLPWTVARTQDGEIIPNHDRTKRLTPKVTLDFHPFLDDTLVYVSYQEAVKAHAYNTYAIYLPPEYVKPEKTTAYEVGLKSTLFDNNLRLSSAAFYYRIDELQTQFVSLVNGGAVSFENAGKAEIRGLDFDITTKVFPSLVDGLEASLNGCWLQKAEYLNYTSASGFDGKTGLFSSANDYTGNRITRSPKVTSAAAFTKLFEITGGPLEVGADYYFNSGYFLGASNTEPLHQHSYNTVGAHVSYLYEPWRLKVTAAGTNLTDEFYTAGVIGTDFGTNYRVAPQLQYNLRLDWSF